VFQLGFEINAFLRVHHGNKFSNIQLEHLVNTYENKLLAVSKLLVNTSWVIQHCPGKKTVILDTPNLPQMFPAYLH